MDSDDAIVSSKREALVMLEYAFVSDPVKDLRQEVVFRVVRRRVATLVLVVRFM